MAKPPARRLPSGVTPLTQSDPSLIGPYRIIGRLFSGPSAAVYAAVSPDGAPSAVMHAGVPTEPGTAGELADRIAAGQRVSSLCAAVAHDGGVHQGSLWTATDYIPGHSLRDHLQYQGPLTGTALTVAAAGYAEALSALHAAGLVHGDIRPESVIVSPDGPHLVDHGLGRWTQRTRAGTSGDAAGWARLVLFGAGRTPARPGRLPEGLESLVQRALSPDPAARPETEEIYLELLLLLGIGEDVPAREWSDHLWALIGEHWPSVDTSWHEPGLWNAAALAASDPTARAGLAEAASRVPADPSALAASEASSGAAVPPGSGSSSVSPASAASSRAVAPPDPSAPAGPVAPSSTGRRSSGATPGAADPSGSSASADPRTSAAPSAPAGPSGPSFFDARRHPDPSSAPGASPFAAPRGGSDPDPDPATSSFGSAAGAPAGVPSDGGFSGHAPSGVFGARPGAGAPHDRPGGDTAASGNAGTSRATRTAILVTVGVIVAGVVFGGGYLLFSGLAEEEPNAVVPPAAEESAAPEEPDPTGIDLAAASLETFLDADSFEVSIHQYPGDGSGPPQEPPADPIGATGNRVWFDHFTYGDGAMQRRVGTYGSEYSQSMYVDERVLASAVPSGEWVDVSDSTGYDPADYTPESVAEPLSAIAETGEVTDERPTEFAPVLNHWQIYDPAYTEPETGPAVTGTRLEGTYTDPGGGTTGFVLVVGEDHAPLNLLVEVPNTGEPVDVGYWNLDYTFRSLDGEVDITVPDPGSVLAEWPAGTF
jgi:serine/threonine protein kinase